jgi:hypothetical protein
VKCGGAAFSRLTRVTQPPSRRDVAGDVVRWEIAPIQGNQAAFGWPHSIAVPSTQMQWRMTAILRAIATFAFFMPMRLISRTPHAFRVDHFLVRWAFRMFSHVDPVPRVVVQESPLDPRRLEAGWRRTRARIRSHLTSMSI